MPAPLAKGPSARRSPSVSPRSSNNPSGQRRRPNLPLQTGLIIAASVLVAAGIAIYESPQVRQWVDQSRRKIAVALHSLGDEIQPNSDDSEEEKKKKREEIIRRNRNELVRRAREEGIAVDLDELARIGQEHEKIEMQQRKRPRSTGSHRSFDDLVNKDGMLKKDEDDSTSMATATASSSSNLRKRQAVSGFVSGTVVANPFTDEANILFDHDDEAPSPSPVPYIESRESSATVQGEPLSLPTEQLIDLTPDSIHLQPEHAQTTSIHSLNSTPLDQRSETSENAPIHQSFYSAHSAESAPFDDDAEIISTGTLTPRSSRSEANDFSTNASLIGSQADDIAVLSMQGDDARSEVFSESGFTDAAYSEISAGDRAGVLTPSSWTDVGSDDESEFGGAGVQNWQQQGSN